jgi:hypothetical protein
MEVLVVSRRDLRIYHLTYASRLSEGFVCPTDAALLLCLSARVASQIFTDYKNVMLVKG